LQNARAADIARVLDTMIEKGFFASEAHATVPPAAVVAYPSTNVIWVRTDRLYVERISGIINELDRSMEPATQSQQEIHIERGAVAPTLGP
jgi:hypothetical protein